MQPPSIQFETPENVQVQYILAGAGVRFVSWLIDQLLVWCCSILLLFVVVMIAMMGTAVFDPEESLQYAMGVVVVAFAFSGVVYFFSCEYLMRGQTIGKRFMNLRVVRANGFSIDARSLLVRNLFRFFESFPPFWITPILSKRVQRMGDMVAGTLVVVDEIDPMRLVRSELADKPVDACRYRFDPTMLSRLTPNDIELLERLLDRWDEIPRPHLRQLVNDTIRCFATKMSTDIPPNRDRLRFLEDLLSADYRRRSRSII